MTEVKYVFNPDKRYITRGINDELPLELQILLWDKVDELVKDKAVKTDYLQVFHLEWKNNELVLTHSQEVPQYKKSYKLPVKDEFRLLVNRKIFVIDDVEHCTMLFANEY